MKKIFVIDDIEITTDLLKKIFENEGYAVEAFSEAQSAIERMKVNCPDLVIMDIEMPKMNGIEALKIIKKIYPDLEVVIMTAYGDMDKIQYFLKHGALDFISKPFAFDKIKNVIAQVLSGKKEDHNEQENLLDRRLKFIGKSKGSRSCIEMALKVSNSNFPVLILGENGTGKEMLAEFIHYNSVRKYNNIIKVNCGAIPQALAESEFFGHEKGAFTGANDSRIGKLELADKGTLFLDEIGDLELSLQTKLLRAIEYRKFERIGGNKTITSDFKLICATNKDLNEEVKSGRFRQDLFYRINTCIIDIPPLRERKEDIEALIKHFISEFGKDYMVVAKSISKETLHVLENCYWSGNIRELKNIIQTMVTFAQNEVLQLQDLPPNLLYNKVEEIQNSEEFLMEEIPTLEYMENLYIQKALKKFSGNKRQAAEALGLSERSLYYKIKSYNIDVNNLK